MDAIITELVNRFERGGLTRRELIQGLSALVAAGGASARAAAQSGGLKATAIDQKQHGLTPDQNVEFGFHIKDPDGAVVQIV